MLAQAAETRFVDPEVWMRAAAPLRALAVVLPLLRTLAAVLAWLAMLIPIAAAAAPQWPDIEVLDQNGQRHRFVSDLLQGEAVAINFIFTGCATVCPPQTALLRAARERLGAQARDVRFISISVDPRSDSPRELSAYAQRFGIDANARPRWSFVTGRPQDIERLLAAFDIRAGAPQSHASMVWIGNPAAQTWTRQSAVNTPEAIAEGLRSALRGERQVPR